MNLKNQITKKVLDILTPQATEQDFNKAFHFWWFNSRNKTNGGLRLTEAGYRAFIDADIKDHIIQFEEPIFISNQLVIWLDQLMDCPYFLTNREVVVFGERTAVQLILFSGNITKYIRALAQKQRDQT